MKTIIPIGIFSIASVLSCTTVVRAQNPVIGHPADPKSVAPTSNSQLPAAAKADRPPLNPADDAARGDAYYYFMMGHLAEQQYEASGKSELATKAIDSYKKALDLAPNSTVIMERLAETRAKAQQLREAVEEARTVLKLDPDNVDAHRLLARIYVRTLGDQGASDSQKENLAKAIEEFQAILRIQPDDTYSSLWLARLYRFENRHNDAEKVLRDVLRRDPGNGPALEQLSQLLIDEGRSQEAVKILSDAAGTSSSPEVYDLLGDAYAQAKDYPRSEEAYRKAADEDPDDPAHLHGLAQALMEQNKYAEALEQFDAAQPAMYPPSVGPAEVTTPAASRRRRKSPLAASAVSWAGRIELSIATGSPPEAAHPAGSIDSKSSTVGGCQDQRRFSIRSCSGASGCGSVTRTVKRRIALTVSHPMGSVLRRGQRSPANGDWVR